MLENSRTSCTVQPSMHRRGVIMYSSYTIGKTVCKSTGTMLPFVSFWFWCFFTSGKASPPPLFDLCPSGLCKMSDYWGQVNGLCTLVSLSEMCVMQVKHVEHWGLNCEYSARRREMQLQPYSENLLSWQHCLFWLCNSVQVQSQNNQCCQLNSLCTAFLY